MNINLKKKLPTAAAPVFVLKKGGKLEGHELFRGLRPGDKKYLGTAVRQFGLKEEWARSLVLPSGRRAIIISRGEKTLTARRAILTARRVIAIAKSEKVKVIAAALSDFAVAGSGEETAELLSVQFLLAHFEFNAHKTLPKEGWPEVREAVIVASGGGAVLEAALHRGSMIGEEVNAARALSNTPGGDMTPALLAAHAVSVGTRVGFTTKVLDEKEIAALKMGGVLGVAKGSSEKPRFIIMEYRAGPKEEKPVVLVGKGVTFDTGGLDIKPSDYMYEMHMDMSGGAAVIHTIAALTRLKVKKNIIGLVPAVENMVSGSSYRPGDILKTMSGKTIEVMNTDAEGRVILSDALTYSKRYDPRLVIDVATLTGAAEVALGQRASALFATDQKLETALREVGEATGDFVWPLPLWEEYEEEIKGTFGDVANLGKTRYGGAITGAVFLWQFIKDVPWVHLDIAPRMTSIEGDLLAKGSAAPSVNLLTRFLQTF